MENMYQNNQSLNSGLVGSASQSSPVREPELSKSCERLRNSVEMLESNLIDLQTRLSGVLSPESPDSSDKVSIPEFSTKLGQELSLCVGRINKAVDFIQQIKNRLEV